MRGESLFFAHTLRMGSPSKFARAVERGRDAWGTLAEHRFTTVAGTLVFFLVMSLAPLLFWLTLLFGKTASDAEIFGELELFGWAKDLLALLRANAAESSAGASIFFLAATLWSSTGFFYHLRRSGEILYNYARKKHGWKVRLAALLYTLALLFFFAAGSTLFVFTNRLVRPLPRLAGRAIVYALLLALGFFGAWLLNGYVCPYRCRPADTALGSFLTAVAWLVASGAFAVSVRFGNREQLYGALTLVVLFLIWLYWMSICFTAGVVFNRRRMQTRYLAHKKL